MKAAYGVSIFTAKSEKVAVYVFLGIFVVYSLYGIYNARWDIVVMNSLYIVVMCFLSMWRGRAFIRITDNDRLLLGHFTVEIKAITRLEYASDTQVRVHYIFQGQPRSSGEMRMKAEDKEDFIATLRRINPAIEVKN